MPHSTHVYLCNEWQIYLPNDTPVAPVSLPKKGKQRDRRFNEVEEERLLSHAKHYQGNIHALTILAIDTGMRRGEMVNSRDNKEIEKHGYAYLCWENFNAKDPTIFLKDTQNGRVVPFHCLQKQKKS